MIFPRNGMLSIWLCVFIGGCASFGKEIPPEWVLAPQKTYPVNDYLVGMGEGNRRVPETGNPETEELAVCKTIARGSMELKQQALSLNNLFDFFLTIPGLDIIL